MHRNRLARLAITLALVSAAALPTLATAQTTRTSIPRYKHIFVIMMENHGYDEIIGNANAPIINSLAQRYGLATNYFGVTHPSEPNYVASIGGSYFGIQDDAPYYTHTIAALAWPSQLESEGLSWKSYQQSMPYAGYPGDDLPQRQQCALRRQAQPLPELRQHHEQQSGVAEERADGRSSRPTWHRPVPNLSYIAPDQCHDMHGGPSACPTQNRGDPQDNFLIPAGRLDYVGGLVQGIMRSPAWRTGNNAIVVVWDEDDLYHGRAAATPTPAVARSRPSSSPTTARAACRTPRRTTTTRCCRRSRMRLAWAACSSPATPRTSRPWRRSSRPRSS